LKQSKAGFMQLIAVSVSVQLPPSLRNLPNFPANALKTIAISLGHGTSNMDAIANFPDAVAHPF
jgi:hypothetical protein